MSDPPVFPTLSYSQCKALATCIVRGFRKSKPSDEDHQAPSDEVHRPTAVQGPASASDTGSVTSVPHYKSNPAPSLALGDVRARISEPPHRIRPGKGVGKTLPPKYPSLPDSPVSRPSTARSSSYKAPPSGGGSSRAETNPTQLALMPFNSTG